jgi:hypothetical protein
MNKAHIPVDHVLDAVKARKLVDVLVMGWDEDGKLYVASSSGRLEDIKDLLRAAEAFLKARAA